MKAFSVIEYSTKNILKNNFVKIGAMKNITPDAIYRSSIKPWCIIEGGVNIGMKAVSDISSSLITDVINKSIPWVVRKYPERFPFLMPINSSSNNVSSDEMGVIQRTISNHFKNQECVH